MALIRTHRDLKVYQLAIENALACSALARTFPRHERSLKDQLTRCGRSPGASVAEAWRKRPYPRVWKNKLSDAQSESGEAQYWLEISQREGYITESIFEERFEGFEKFIAQITNMIINPKPWIMSRK